MFGYQNHRNGDGYVHRVIDQHEAGIIRRLFTAYAEGAGLVRIAHALNTDAISSPRGGSGSWTPSAVREMLRRPLYKGVVIWNKTQKITRRGTKGQRRRPEHEWLERPAPHLAIVDENLWQRVHARLRDRATVARHHGARRHPDESGYLLVGFTRCGLCRGPIGTDLRAHGSGGHRHHVPHYACLDHKKRGNAVCRNAVGLAQARLDGAVLDAIATALHPSVVQVAIDKALEMLTRDDTERTAQRAKLEREAAQVQARIDRLVAALADGGVPLDQVRPRLAAEKDRKTELHDELARLGRLDGVTRRDAVEMRRRLHALAAHVGAVLRGDTAEARRILRALLADKIDMDPFGRGARARL